MPFLLLPLWHLPHPLTPPFSGEVDYGYGAQQRRRGPTVLSVRSQQGDTPTPATQLPILPSKPYGVQLCRVKLAMVLVGASRQAPLDGGIGELQPCPTIVCMHAFTAVSHHCFACSHGSSHVYQQDSRGQAQRSLTTTFFCITPTKSCHLLRYASCSNNLDPSCPVTYKGCCWSFCDYVCVYWCCCCRAWRRC